MLSIIKYVRYGRPEYVVVEGDLWLRLREDEGYAEDENGNRYEEVRVKRNGFEEVIGYRPQ